MMNIKDVLFQWFTHSLIKKTSGSGIENENMSDQRPSDLATRQLVEELHKPIINKFKKIKVQSLFICNIWGSYLVYMQVISTFNKGFRLLSCAIDIYSKYAWVIPLKDKKGITITNAFKKNVNESNRKPNKICVDKSSEFYNSPMKSWLEKMI